MEKLVVPYHRILDLRIPHYISGKDAATRDRAEAMMSDGQGNLRIDLHDKFLASLTPEEQDEYWRLFEENEKAEHMAAECYVEGEDGVVHRPCDCIFPTKTSLDVECVRKCPRQIAGEKAAKELRDFFDSHGVHFCIDCKHWGLEWRAYCDKHKKYVLPDCKACKDYGSFTELEDLEARKEGIFEPDEERKAREKYEAEHQEEMEEIRRESRMKRGKELLNDIYQAKKSLVCSLVRYSPDYYKRLIEDFPEVFKGSPCPTWEKLLEWSGVDPSMIIFKKGK